MSSKTDESIVSWAAGSLRLVFALVLVSFAMSLPCQAADPASAPATSALAKQGYILGSEDVIEVEVLGQSDFKVRAPIGEDGTIKLPYIGSIQAAGKTTDQLSGDISQALISGGYFAHPILSVEIVAYASRYVTVLGEVTSPGLVPIDRPYHLSEILARVGGVRTDSADYLILRPQDGPERRYLISALATGDEAQDPMVSPGDRIFAPVAELFYISGEVKTPGAYPMTTGMTLRMAIGRGGGLTDIGTYRGVKVTHKDGKVDRPGLDDKIAPGDVIVVGERLF